MAAGPPRRPLSAFALSLSAGILIVVCAFVLLLFAFGFLFVFGLFGLAFGTIILFASVMMYARPREHSIWGVVVLVFSCVSILGLGGFILGMVLGIVGGALGISWRPEGPAIGAYGPTPAYLGYGAAPGMNPYFAGPPPGTYGIPVTPWRMCMGCGRWIPWSSNVCPLCGTQAPVSGWVPRAAEMPPPAVPIPPPVPAGPFPGYGPHAPAPVYAAPQPPPPRPPPLKEPCPTCTGDAEWNAAAGRWYCPAESKFF